MVNVMSWGSVSEFFAMGGYGWYVWGSYAVTFVLVALELLLVAGRHRSARQRYDEGKGNANDTC